MEEEHKLAQAASDAAKVISRAESDAVQRIANAASEALNVNNKQSSIDHDEFIEFRAEMKTKLDNIQKTVDGLTCRDDKFTLKEDFVWWRNLLVSGMILSIFLAVALSLLEKFIK